MPALFNLQIVTPEREVFNAPVDLLISYFGDIAKDANLTNLVGQKVNSKNDLGPTLRYSRRGSLLWGFNYGLEVATVPQIEGAQLLIGSKDLEIQPGGIAVWKLKAT